MSKSAVFKPISIDAKTVAEIDALASATDRSRDEIVNQAIEQYLETSAWQIERIKDGMVAAREGRIAPAAEVFASLAVRHGWDKRG